MVAICAWAAITLLVVGNSDYQSLRLLFALPLLLFFSGHSVLRAVGSIATSLIEHAVYAVGVSLFVALAGGLFLNHLEALTPNGWALWLLAVVAASTAIVLWRKPSRGVIFTLRTIPGLNAYHLVAICSAGMMIGGAYALAASDEVKHQEFKYVQFWMVGADKGPGALIVGIKSAELEPQIFDVEVVRGTEVIAVWRSISLDPGQTWTKALGLSIDPQFARKISARLYGHNDGKLYRQVTAIVPSA